MWMRAQNRCTFQVAVHSRHAWPSLSLLTAFLMKVLVLLMRTGSLDIAQISFYLHFRSLACQQLRWSCRPNAIFPQEGLGEHLEGYEKWNSFQEAVWVWPSPPMLYEAGHGDLSASSSRKDLIFEPRIYILDSQTQKILFHFLPKRDRRVVRREKNTTVPSNGITFMEYIVPKIRSSNLEKSSWNKWK